ncbi:MAG: hypothetical protein F7C32_03340 [Desulfurococcales archaeon]|nr:hypothetical protein [Desulfurococcales archaeon]
MISSILGRIVGKASHDPREQANMEYQRLIMGLADARDRFGEWYLRIMEEIKSSKEKLEIALRNNDKETAFAAMYNIWEKKKLARAAKALELIYDWLIDRARTASDITQFRETVNAFVPYIMELQKQAHDQGGDLASGLTYTGSVARNVTDSISATLTTAETAAAHARPVPAEAEKVVREMLGKAEHEVDRFVPSAVFPEPPAQTLEERVYLYIIQNRGRKLSVSSIASALGEPVENVRQAVYALYRKGKIKISAPTTA